jgi:hypothetical protein
MLVINQCAKKGFATASTCSTDAGKGKRWKDIDILQHHNCARCLNCLALKAPRSARKNGGRIRE